MPSLREIFTEVGLSGSFLTSKRGGIELPGTGKSIIGIRGWLGGWNKKGLLHYAKEKNFTGKLLEWGLQNGFVDSYVKKLCVEINDRPGSIVIGYSMGGIVTLRYLQLHGSSKVDSLVLVGCPLNGAKQAGFLKKLGGVYEDLSPNSPILSLLEGFDPGIKTVHLFASWDQFVGDPRSINGPGEKIVLPIKGHVQLMNDLKYIGGALDSLL